MHYILFYDTSPDYLQRRAEFRDAHLALAWQCQSRGELVLAGAVGDPIDGAMLLFKSDSAKVAEDFAASDPYVVNGLVTSWRVQPWNTVVGQDASRPTRPA
jgi:uncharacterized protein YciI